MAAQWEKLFAIACDLIDQVNRDFKIIDSWTLGGGTALMLQISHRASDDIDVFLDDHQVLPYLDPGDRVLISQSHRPTIVVTGRDFKRLSSTTSERLTSSFVRM